MGHPNGMFVVKKWIKKLTRKGFSRNKRERLRGGVKNQDNILFECPHMGNINFLSSNVNKIRLLFSIYNVKLFTLLFLLTFYFMFWDFICIKCCLEDHTLESRLWHRIINGFFTGSFHTKIIMLFPLQSVRFLFYIRLTLWPCDLLLNIMFSTDLDRHFGNTFFLY